jgi:hypothetical protein
VEQVVLRTGRGSRVVEANELRRELGLRSTWFQVGVIRLDAPARVRRGPLVLRGIARNVAGAVIQRNVAGGWKQVARVRPRANGTFAVKVRATATARYRIAAERTPAPAAVVRVVR